MITRTLWWRATRDAIREVDGKDLSLIAAGCAFFGLVGIFPAIAALIAIFGLVADPVVVRNELELLQGVIPPDAYELFEAQIESLLAARTDQLGWASALSIMVALWSARGAVASMMSGLNAIHGTSPRGGLRSVLVALAVTVSLIGVAVCTMLIVLVMPVLLAFLPLGPVTAWALEGLRWLAAMFILLAGLGILYRFGPNARGDRPGWISPGAVIVVICWLVASIGFTIYVSNFGRYNEVYGSLGAVIALLMWLYISALLVLAGAALNAAIRRLRRAEKAEKLHRERLTRDAEADRQAADAVAQGGATAGS
ncbi:YihY/virulence factor BrkB family protein [Pelagovum pacificum]|uniref:YihY/virulence factor BrkB family protein n=1 Tax=Pelagovum pacificum TaxID=2588711 RepID=A0A5C5G9A0_9RHOB|nr:YihY/virulence factor BrkB family protein [Pelagovum pacificum]QQA41872.1 YihY/virulence factor BrkB family protein [Pelagovum pacificum]TNY30685.1 YihY/virulence factor BrkB family protein [Pelagovum pacificum]